MKNNGPLTGREKVFDENKILVSITDLKGRLIYVNEDFIDISGFSKDELIGKAHNIVRSPDIPSEIFQNLWDFLKNERNWIGIIKNRCKNGDHYWVEAFVSPMYKNNVCIGFQSVRVKPKEEDLKRTLKIYDRLKNGKKNSLSIF
ncbi:PAS domain S-box protein [Candidatus Gracilibacteria bacterium]|nr:PAS domain S-box protein [Candidatus Gracilibacteria bacterium]